jgi:hypothetical protein
VQILSARIGWSHQLLLLDSFADEPETYIWCAHMAAEQRWSVRRLGHIDLKLHQRQGVALTTFPKVLEPDDAGAALRATKDRYIFDFLELSEDARERELEALIDDIQNFLIDAAAAAASRGCAASTSGAGAVPCPAPTASQLAGAVDRRGETAPEIARRAGGRRERELVHRRRRRRV